MGGAATALALTAAMFVAVPSATGEPDAGAVSSTESPSALHAPTTADAMQLAVTSGQRVEDKSQQDEVTQVYANPDGTWTSETAPEPVRALHDGEWTTIDTTLVKGPDGEFGPKVAVGGVTFSDGGDRTFATVVESGTELSYRWTSALPEPIIDGDTATYRNVMPFSDLVLTATPSGFTHSIVIRKSAGQFDELSVPVAAPGTQIVETEAGGVAVETRDGRGWPHGQRHA